METRPGSLRGSLESHQESRLGTPLATQESRATLPATMVTMVMMAKPATQAIPLVS
jgi:hypothetical protein